jgi:hypothetical protein
MCSRRYRWLRFQMSAKWKRARPSRLKRSKASRSSRKTGRPQMSRQQTPNPGPTLECTTTRRSCDIESLTGGSDSSALPSPKVEETLSLRGSSCSFRLEADGISTKNVTYQREKLNSQNVSPWLLVFVVLVPSAFEAMKTWCTNERAADCKGIFP